MATFRLTPIPQAPQPWPAVATTSMYRGRQAILGCADGRNHLSPPPGPTTHCGTVEQPLAPVQAADKQPYSSCLRRSILTARAAIPLSPLSQCCAPPPARSRARAAASSLQHQRRNSSVLSLPHSVACRARHSHLWTPQYQPPCLAIRSSFSPRPPRQARPKMLSSTNKCRPSRTGGRRHATRVSDDHTRLRMS
jgi:hypothetical protein